MACKNKHNLVVSTSPYWFTPPAAHSLAAHFHYLLNERFMNMGLMPVRYVKLHRSAAPVLDFSKLNAEDRKKNMKKDALSIDPKALKGKTLILIEDSRITGAHEGKIISHAKKFGVKGIIFVYVVNIANGIQDPNIENRINHVYINDLTMLYRLMLNPKDFAFNSRVCRFLLSWKNADELQNFFAHLSDKLLFTIYVSAINDGYALVEKFSKGFNLLKIEIASRNNIKEALTEEELPVISIAVSQQ